MSSIATGPKALKVIFYQRAVPADSEWRDQTDWPRVETMLEGLAAELGRLNVALTFSSDATLLIIRGYGDILNSVRLCYPQGGFPNACLGHVIGSSPNRDLAADLKRGINRLLFAPETVEPQGSDKVVCHNCGCGC
jgi:hypothetical protein